MDNRPELPDTPEAHRAAAIELRKRGRLDEALAHITRALELRPDYPAGHYNLATIRLDQGRADDAAKAWRRAIELKTDYHQAYAGLSAAFRHLGRHNEAIAAANKAISLQPDDVNAQLSLATALYGAMRMPEAAAQFERVLTLDPDNIFARNNYGNLLADIDHPAYAAEQYKAALRLDPNRVEILNNLGNVLKAQGRLDEAIDCFRATLKARPRAADLHSNLLLTLNCQIKSDRGLLDDHVAWANQHAARFTRSQNDFRNSRDPERRLRIGYVSADFRRHSVLYFIEPVIQAHHRAQFEIFLYSSVRHADDMTKHLASLANHWRSITGIDDERAAKMIRDDQIDILIDLGGHTASNRLLIFARKPAPIQITYLGYPNTTGLTTIDYRLTDAISDPPGMTEPNYSEKLLRLPKCFLCYRPSGSAPEARELPSSDPATITFGSFNNFAKVTQQSMSLWAEVLKKVPNSTLLLKADCLGDRAMQQAVRSDFAAFDIDPARIDLLGHEKSFLKHLAVYHRLDIALDTFPYNGTTTTCEAMWMGVPVVTLAGHAHASRVGGSLLNAVGLRGLVANHPLEFIKVAAELAQDHARRREISGSKLRERMRASPLMDEARFVLGLEEAYRQIWRDWCSQSPALQGRG